MKSFHSLKGGREKFDPVPVINDQSLMSHDALHFRSQ